MLWHGYVMLASCKTRFYKVGATECAICQSQKPKLRTKHGGAGCIFFTDFTQTFDNLISIYYLLI